MDSPARRGGSGPAPPADAWRVDGSFTVAEYRAPEFKVDLAATTPWALSGQALPITLTASYFFGAPLAGATARWSLSQRPFEFRPPGFDDYSFTDPDIVPEYEWLVGRGETALDVAGQGFLTPLADLGTTPVSLTWSMEVEVRDETGRASAATIERPVHRGLAYPGVALDDRLVMAGRPVSASIVLLDPDGQPARNATAQVRLVRRDWRTVRRLLVGGIIGSETTTVDTVLDRRALAAGPGVRRMTFQVPGAGYYRLVVEATDGAKNRQQSAAEFYAAGPGDYAWGWEPGVKLELVADRDRYQPGDTAHVLVRSPVAGATALITVEREGILTHWTRRLTGTSEVVDVPIPRIGAAPNLYLSVAMILGSDARRGADPR
ncbi:MAG: alpha-2-macroglobulin domain-containing protein, partial [bacterium]